MENLSTLKIYVAYFIFGDNENWYNCMEKIKQNF